MTKYIATEGEGFGSRRAALRKATGYTQEQLASELGISRRRIAYYEAESDHPPVGLIADLARVLSTTTDALLGHGAGKTKTRSVSLSPRHERFGGVTAFMRSPATGLWADETGQARRDELVTFEVMTETLDRDW